MLSPVLSFGQFFQRLEIGYNYVSTTGNYNGVSQVLDGGGNFAGDTTIKRSVSGVGFGADIGTTIPLKRIGHVKMWGLSIHLVFNEFVWGALNETYSMNGNFNTASTNMTGLTEQFALPIGIDYKIGPDAILTKRLHVGASFGIGVMPSLNETVMVDPQNLSGAGGTAFGINPYVKAEVSFFAGICFKVRGQFSFGDIPFIDQQKSLAGLTDGPFKVTGTTNLMLSFIIMPFSMTWGERSWVNTYDTYNPYER